MASSGPRINGGSEIAEFSLLFGGCAYYPGSTPTASQAYCPKNPSAVNATGNYAVLGDTWISTRSSWLKIFDRGAAGAPAPRWGAMMVYDPSTNTTVMTGGCCSGTGVLFQDTWMFKWNGCQSSTAITVSGCAWQQVTTPSPPEWTGRALAASSFAGPGKALMYGGYVRSQVTGRDIELAQTTPFSIHCSDVSNQTWIFDFNLKTWTKQNVIWGGSPLPTGPPSTCNSVGGPTVQSRGHPLPIYGAMASPWGATSAPVLYGGSVPDGIAANGSRGGTSTSETWTWSGQGWTAANGDTNIHIDYCIGQDTLNTFCSPPGPRSGAAMSREDATGSIALFAGCFQGLSPACNTQSSVGCPNGVVGTYCLWNWDGTAWSVRPLRINNFWGRFGMAVAGGKMPLWMGGHASSSSPTLLFNDAYGLNSSYPSLFPLGAWQPAWWTDGVLDSWRWPHYRVRGGGSAGDPLQSEIWMGGSPSSRAGAAMTDTGTQTILFGGRDRMISDLNDTWVRRDGAWINAVPGVYGAPTGSGVVPPPRANASLVGLGDGTAVMFGGAKRVECGSTMFCQEFYNDVWLWSGSAWSPVQTTPGGASSSDCSPVSAGGPAPRMSAGMAFYPEGYSPYGSLVIFGGEAPGAAAVNPEDLQPLEATSAFCDTWVLTFANVDHSIGYWQRLCYDGGPTPCGLGARTGVSMGFDPTLGSVVAYGGRAGWTFYGDTWLFTWSGSAWDWEGPFCYDSGAGQPRSPNVAGPPCFQTSKRIAYSSPLTHDDVSGDMLTFGGWGGEDIDCSSSQWACSFKALEHDQLSTVAGTIEPESNTFQLVGQPPTEVVVGAAIVFTGSLPEVKIVQSVSYSSTTGRTTVTLTSTLDPYRGNTTAWVLPWQDHTSSGFCHQCTFFPSSPWWPQPQNGAQFVWDSRRDEAVLFEGVGNRCYTNSCGVHAGLGDTWTWRH